MKALLLSSAALIAFSSMAAAADLPMRAAPPAPIAAVPVFSWGGFYAGVHGAWIRNDVDAIGSRTVGAPVVPASVSLYDSGFGGGAQVGYLMEFGTFVAGIEADITATDIGRTRTRLTAGGARTVIGSDMDYFGTVKGRVGLSFASFLPFFQQSMVYVTGGLGYAGSDHRVRVTAAGFGAAGRSDDTSVGWVIGAGTENAISRNISIKTETLYYNLEDTTITLRNAGARVGYRFENDGWLSRVGLNVRF